MQLCIWTGLNPIKLWWEKVLMITKCFSLSRFDKISTCGHRRKYDIYGALQGVLVYSVKTGRTLSVGLCFGHIVPFWDALNMCNAKLSTLRGRQFKMRQSRALVCSSWCTLRKHARMCNVATKTVRPCGYAFEPVWTPSIFHERNCSWLQNAFHCPDSIKSQPVGIAGNMTFMAHFRVFWCIA